MRDNFMKSMEQINIYYDNEMIYLLSYENLLMKTYMDILNDSCKKNLVVGLDFDLSNIIMLFIVAIKNYYDNMKNPNNNVLDNLKDGDMVVYKGKRGIYKGIVEIDGEKVHIQNKGTDSTYIPVEKAYLISPYFGQAKTANKQSGFSEEENITKNLVSMIYAENVNNLTGTIKNKVLIVSQNKDKLLELIENIKIEFKGIDYGFSELFTMGYYTNEENFLLLKGNKFKENLQFKITSNLTVATDIIKSDKEINTVILIGEKCYKEALETKLRFLENKKDIEKLIILDTWKSTVDFSCFVSEENLYNTYALNKYWLFDNVDLYEYDGIGNYSIPQEESVYLRRIALEKSFNIEVASCSKSSLKLINNTKKILKDLCIESSQNNQLLEFIKRSYSVCNALETSILPIKHSDELRESIDLRLIRLKEIITFFSIERYEFKLMELVIENLENLNFEYFLENPKFKLIQKILNSRKNKKRKKKNLIVVKNDFDLKDKNKYRDIFDNNKLTITRFNKKIKYEHYDSVIFTFPCDNQIVNVLNNQFINNLKFILNPTEIYKMKRIMKENEEMLRKVYKHNLLNSEYESESILTYSDQDDNEITEVILESEVNEEIEKVLNENWLNILINSSQNGEYNNANSNVIAKSLVEFEDSKGALLTENYQAHIIDREEQDIKIKSINELEIGDEIVFVNTRTHEKGDIIKETIGLLLNYEDFNAKYGNYFFINNKWKQQLSDYMENYNFTSKHISKMFRLYNASVEPLSINNWLNGNIIGPQDSHNLKIIAEIVGSEFMKENIDEIINTCKSLRSIQIAIRKSIAKMIMNTIVGTNNDDNEIYRLVCGVISDFEEFAYVGRIINKTNVDKKISNTYVNRVIDEEVS